MINQEALTTVPVPEMFSYWLQGGPSQLDFSAVPRFMLAHRNGFASVEEAAAAVAAYNTHRSESPNG